MLELKIISVKSAERPSSPKVVPAYSIALAAVIINGQSFNMKAHLKELSPFEGSEPHSHELLIINESFYIEDRVNEIDPDAWYEQGTSLLSETERPYVNYRDIFDQNKLPDGRWKARGCTIYRVLEAALTEAGFPKIHNMLNHCTLANCFLRPALNGNSLNPKQIDVDIAKEYLVEFVERLKPKLIICASSNAYYAVVRDLKFDCPVVHTSHPVSVWWNRDGGKCGRTKFINSIKETLFKT